ncbi:DUF447 family protein [Halobacteria archaeon AArc-m2/3/4]|uniref:DUF447 family protein n=1 Tax=Natronoglomus mannanivorans TaxID=2979990 RepID=A0ABT2QEB7_9EURY|nr:DUF447 family protein [Halobacteria archaeon AArc-m2/3/4]
MTGDPGGVGKDEGDGNGDGDESWPVTLEGVTETVVTTLGPNGRWNAAALGLFAGEVGHGDEDGHDERDDENAGTQRPITATTWGNTRTRRNFHRTGEGYVQFTVDPLAFVDAALSITELETDPILESTNAWVRVSVDRVDAGTENGTEWERWELTPLESRVLERRVPTVSRGFGAVVEATVAASRLDVAGYDDERLLERLAYCESVVERAGSDREREAIERVRTYSAWGESDSSENESL